MYERGCACVYTVLYIWMRKKKKNGGSWGKDPFVSEVRLSDRWHLDKTEKFYLALEWSKQDRGVISRNEVKSDSWVGFLSNWCSPEVSWKKPRNVGHRVEDDVYDLMLEHPHQQPTTTKNLALRPFLTDYLQAPVLVKLPDVSRAEPPLAVLIHKEVVLVFRLHLVVSHGHVGSADQNLSPRMRLVCAAITAWKKVRKKKKNQANERSPNKQTNELTINSPAA